MTWSSIGFGLISSIAWIAAAIVTPDFSKSYYGGPPLHISRRAKIGWACNAVGAFCAALSVGLQAWVTASTTL